MSLPDPLRGDRHDKVLPGIDQASPDDDPAIEAAMQRLRDGRLFMDAGQGNAVATLARIGAPAIPALLEALRDPDVRVQGRAVCALKAIGGPAAVDLLRQYVRASLLRRTTRTWKRSVRVLPSDAKLMLILVTLMVVGRRVRDANALDAIVIACEVAVAVYGVSAVLKKLCCDRTVEIRKVAMEAIIEAKDLRDVDLLARCLRDEEPVIRRHAAVAVQALLRQLQANHAGLISEEAMAALIRELRGKNKNLILAILSALEQVGDELMVSAVERLTQRRDAGQDTEVHEAAWACLPALRQRVDRSQQAHALLRPAEEANDVTSTLVRPAHTTASATEILVRPAGTGEV